jgi:hypothetical protein
MTEKKRKIGVALKFTFEELRELLGLFCDMPPGFVHMDIWTDRNRDIIKLKMSSHEPMPDQYGPPYWCEIPEGGEYPERQLDYEELYKRLGRSDLIALKNLARGK